MASSLTVDQPQVKNAFEVSAKDLVYQSQTKLEPLQNNDFQENAEQQEDPYYETSENHLASDKQRQVFKKPPLKQVKLKPGSQHKLKSKNGGMQ